MQLVETKDRIAMNEQLLNNTAASEVFIGPEEKVKILELVKAFRDEHSSDAGMLEMAEVYFVAAAVLAARVTDSEAQYKQFITDVIKTIDGKL